MKPIFLASFFLIIVSSLIFAFIYMQWRDVVESNPAFFTLTLMSCMITGMIGMMYSIISNTSLERQSKY